MSACHTARIATVSFALTALIGFAEPAGAAITANALTNNAITANALTNNGLHVNGLDTNLLTPPSTSSTAARRRA